MRRAVLDQSIPHDEGVEGRVSISIGVISGCAQEGIDVKKFLLTADECLYRAKPAGRNRVFATSCCNVRMDNAAGL